ncbi:MAG TPA: hypothetical protein VF096_13965 [Azonexus sp.]
MLKIFQSIFGGPDSAGRHPDALIEMATERAIDGLYPRLRLLPGYRRQLREPVCTALDHVVALIDAFPAPLAARSANYAQSPLLTALFAAPEQMREVFASDPALGEFRAGHPGGEPVTALLLAECREKNTLGMALEGEMLRRDVAQVTVSFARHRLADPAASEGETRRQLKRRAFDHLVGLALWRVSEARSERVELNQQRDLLRNKLGILQRGGWSFAEAAAEPVDALALQAELDQLEAQLAGLPIDERNMGGQLDILCEVLAGAERQLWATPGELYLDRMNVKRDAGHPDARPIRFTELHNARGERLAMLLLTLDPQELPAPESFSAQADRLLAGLGPARPH